MTESLQKLSKLKGVEALALGANRPLPLDSQDVLVVLQGTVHLFWQADAHTRRIPFLVREAGQAFLGFGESSVIVVGSPGCRVARMSRQTAQGAPDAAKLLAEWLVASTAFLADSPTESLNLSLESSKVSLDPNQVIGSQGPVYVRSLSAGSLTVEGRRAPQLLALPPLLRATAQSGGEVETVSVDKSLETAGFWEAQDFHLEWTRERLAQRATETRQHHEQRILSREATAGQALNEGLIRLTSALPGNAAAVPFSTDISDELFSVVKRVTDASSIVAKRPVAGRNDFLDPLARIAQASGFRTRAVTLPDGWSKRDAGHLLGFRNDEPVALIRIRPGFYHLFEAGNPVPTPVSAQVAKELNREAFVFYRPLPPDCTTFTSLMGFAWSNIRRDMAVIGILCILGAIMAMATPVGLGWLVDTVIPSGQVTELVALGLGLGLATLVSATATVGQAITALRIGSRVDADVQAAMTDRLLGLPAAFFRKYSSGDLTNRLLGFQALVQSATGSLLTAILAAVMSSTNLVLMFYYDFWLATIALLLISGLLTFILVCAVIDLGFQRTVARARGELSSLVYQFISGISKIKVANAQTRAFERWSRLFSSRTRIMYRSTLIQSNINAVMKVFNTASMILFIGYLAHYDYKALSTADFLALTSAYGAFLGSINMASASLTMMLTTIPLAERFAPILAQEGEVTQDLPDPGELGGRVEVSHVSFRYGPDEPLILKDVSLKAEPGEFIAVVGPSGSGKSTLFRMLLGFDDPSQGSVYFDGQELAGVNKQAVRRQLGVVLQNGQLMPGSILSNIVGSSLLTLDDAWKAAEIAGLADDIRAMPMQMHTVVSEGGGAFSGGQRQRLLIARAVVAQPKLLLLDEATSALDSRTQEEVSRQLNELQATRVVIAHRLSTIEKADRIYVLKDGLVEQVGTYDELVAVPGTFQELARRQML